MKFLYISRYSTNKQLEQYISLAESLKEHTFLHIGSGNKEIFESLKNSRVVFLGSVDEETKNDHLVSCDAYICTSSYEGFNLPILEAIDANKTVFASALPVHLELFGSYIIYCNTVEEFVQKIQKWIEHGCVRPDQILRKTILEKYTWENTSRKLLEVIENVFK
jgi:glycosyltransferase involved in cell wall biosynthesis